MKKQTVVCVAYKGDREHQHADSMECLKWQHKLTILSAVKSAYVGKSRSALATQALALGADVVFFIDSDSLFNPDDVERLSDVARETRGIVGAPYSQRSMGASIVGGFADSVKEATFFEGGGLYPASGVIGMGFTAIHREVFEQLDVLPEMQPVLYGELEVRRYFHEAVVDGHWLHEDATFCHLARSIGCRTDLDTRFRVLHMGEYAFGIEDCRQPVARAQSIHLGFRR